MKNKAPKPFIKWAGGKRWLVANTGFSIPDISGRYIEPFLGGAAVFFHTLPDTAILSDANPKLIATYQAVKDDWSAVYRELKKYVTSHDETFYYQERSRKRRSPHTLAAQFIYLNRTCFNGLYRENKLGQFNVPVGKKTSVLRPDDDFAAIADSLRGAELICQDFELTIAEARAGDFVFVDPPYTVAHNENGFIQYNQNIFSWSDQMRLRDSIEAALNRGAVVYMTNANHESIHELYEDLGNPLILPRASKISGSLSGRGSSTETLYQFSK